MNVKIRRVDDDLKFEAANAGGYTVTTDGSPKSEGMRPMELLLAAVGTCAAFDLVHILRKQRQEVADVSAEVRGLRPDEGVPKPFGEIHIAFTLRGNPEEEKARRAAALAVEKYCSAGANLREDTEVTWSLDIEKTSEAEKRS